MVTYDNIKIRLSRMGYLPDLPYHLISDREMCNAFIGDETSYFFTAYPNFVGDHILIPGTDITGDVAYNNLVSAIRYYVKQLVDSRDVFYRLPDWVCSYMLGAVISVESSIDDIHDFLVQISADNIDDEYNKVAQVMAFKFSYEWLRHRTSKETGIYQGTEIDLRPPTMFGEAHIIKSMRLRVADPLEEG